LKALIARPERSSAWLVGVFFRKDSMLSAGARKFVELCQEQWT